MQEQGNCNGICMSGCWYRHFDRLYRSSGAIEKSVWLRFRRLQFEHCQEHYLLAGKATRKGLGGSGVTGLLIRQKVLWRNGQRVWLRIRRLQVRVLPGSVLFSLARKGTGSVIVLYVSWGKYRRRKCATLKIYTFRLLAAACKARKVFQQCKPNY
jgi:hypothetical protein